MRVETIVANPGQDIYAAMKEKARWQGKKLLVIQCVHVTFDSALLIGESIMDDNTIILLDEGDKLSQECWEMFVPLFEKMPKSNECIKLIFQ
jgi:hypothetical protein